MSRSINFLRRYRDLLVVLGLLLLPFVFYVSNSKAVRDHNAFDRAVVFLSAPGQWLLTTSLDTTHSLWHRYVALVGLSEANDALVAENAELRGQLAMGEEMRHENERLRRLVGLRERAPATQMLLAQVVATSPSPLFRSIRIDRGSRDGLALGAAVVSHDGVVGRVAALSAAYADVMMLVDNNSSTDVLVQRTRARARVRGQGGDEGLGIDLQFLARTADVAPGDVLITSGLSSTFPKGLRVGTVMSVERRAFGLYQRATVRPSVDFGRIEAVMVVMRGFAPEASFEVPDAAPSGPLQEPPPPLSTMPPEGTLLPALKPAPPAAPAAPAPAPAAPVKPKVAPPEQEEPPPVLEAPAEPEEAAPDELEVEPEPAPAVPDDSGR